MHPTQAQVPKTTNNALSMHMQADLHREWSLLLSMLNKKAKDKKGKRGETLLSMLNK